MFRHKNKIESAPEDCWSDEAMWGIAVQALTAIRYVVNHIPDESDQITAIECVLAAWEDAK